MGMEVIEATADNGYQEPYSLAQTLENGIIPNVIQNVIQNDGSSVVDVTYDFEPADITDELLSSASQNDIRSCLHAGVVPKCMKGMLTDAHVDDALKYNREYTDSDVAKMTLEEMIAKAREGYYVRDAERNMAICP